LKKQQHHLLPLNNYSVKILLTVSLLFASIIAIGQSTAETITIGTNKLTLTTDCKADTDTKISCGNNTVEWKYGDEQKVKGLQDAFLEMGGMLDRFKKKKIELYLLETKVKGYKVSYKNATGTTYQISAAGVINGEPIWILVSLEKEPVTNDDMPHFVKQIIRFSEAKK
jgi:hypothetical protein